MRFTRTGLGLFFVLLLVCCFSTPVEASLNSSLNLRNTSIVQFKNFFSKIKQESLSRIQVRGAASWDEITSDLKPMMESTKKFIGGPSKEEKIKIGILGGLLGGSIAFLIGIFIWKLDKIQKALEDKPDSEDHQN